MDEGKLSYCKGFSDHRNTFDVMVHFAEVCQRFTNGEPILEIGTRQGGSALALMNIFKKRWFFTVDPYQEFYFENDDTVPGKGTKISMDLYRDAMALLAFEAKKLETNWTHYLMTDYDFMDITRYVKISIKGKWYFSDDIKYSFVYLDGPHSTEYVKNEISYFKDKMVTGGCIVIDDCNNLDDIPKILSDCDISAMWYKQQTEDKFLLCYDPSDKMVELL